MKERAESRGFRVCALGAFVSRHSMAPEVGVGRPDAKDEAIMADFGRSAYEKILAGDYALHRQPVTHWSSSEQFNQYIAFRETNKEPYCFLKEFRAKKISDDCIHARPASGTARQEPSTLRRKPLTWMPALAVTDVSTAAPGMTSLSPARR